MGWSTHCHWRAASESVEFWSVEHGGCCQLIHVCTVSWLSDGDWLTPRARSIAWVKKACENLSLFAHVLCQLIKFLSGKFPLAAMSLLGRLPFLLLMVIDS